MKIRVGIAEHPDHFKHAIKEGQVPLPDIELVVHANNGWLLKHELEEKRPTLDIILIDVDMPVMSDVETSVWLREKQPSVKLIAMAEFGFDPKLRKMLIAGCCSFFEKTRAPDEFATAIRRTYSKNYYNPEAEELILWNPCPMHLTRSCSSSGWPCQTYYAVVIFGNEVIRNHAPLHITCKENCMYHPVHG